MVISKCNEKDGVSFSEEVTAALESEGRMEHRLGFRGKCSRQRKYCFSRSPQLVQGTEGAQGGCEGRLSKRKSVQLESSLGGYHRSIRQRIKTTWTGIQLKKNRHFMVFWRRPHDLVINWRYMARKKETVSISLFSFVSLYIWNYPIHCPELAFFSLNCFGDFFLLFSIMSF